MSFDDEIRVQLLAAFDPLRTAAAAKAFPPPSTLSKNLEKLIPADGTTRRNVDKRLASFYSTAAVDMWLRSVHSFLISASLTEASPIWASVSGYYSSHYSVRGLAHLLGTFQLYRRKRVVELRLENGRFVCLFRSKDGRDAEHKLYWKLVSQSKRLPADGFFGENNPDSEFSDVRHRNYANYADHLVIYPRFKPLDEDTMRKRIEFISKIVFDTPPLPRFSKFPDLEFVQLVAYHRLVKIRTMLDETLGGKNRFWNVHRNPAFAAEFMDFQLAQGTPLSTTS